MSFIQTKIIIFGLVKLVIEKINFVEKIENQANLPEVRAIEDFWSDLKG